MGIPLWAPHSKVDSLWGSIMGSLLWETTRYTHTYMGFTKLRGTLSWTEEYNILGSILLPPY